VQDVLLTDRHSTDRRPTDRRSGRVRPRFWFGLRPRLLGALVLTAAVTLATAALTLLAPLNAALKSDTVRIAQGTVTVDRATVASLPVLPDGLPSQTKLQQAVDRLFHTNGAEFVVWTDHLRRWADSDPESKDPIDFIAPDVVRKALRQPGRTPLTLSGDVLVVATRYAGQSYGSPPRPGRHMVLEMIRHVDYVGTANGVVRTVFVDAAVVGLVVALVLGVAFSSRLLRRLRRLRDASRSLDGGEVDKLVVAETPISDEIGELVHAFATMYGRLRQQEDARRTFVATASHELRTPLSSLDGMLELLDDDLSQEPIDLPDARARVRTARQQSRRLASLASDLLDLSRIDAQLELRSEPVELGETARAVVAEFAGRARERETDIVLDEVNGQSWAQADPGSVARILRILLDNALRFAPPHTTVSVRVGASAAESAVEVVDEGPGVPADERELIFGRFQRGRSTGDEGGFGLGLAIGSELAIRMGGTLRLTDASPGAAFRLVLPPAADA
jgi:signal transduction histidine kinase